eukprot:IDg12732t1
MRAQANSRTFCVEVRSHFANYSLGRSRKHCKNNERAHGADRTKCNIKRRAWHHRTHSPTHRTRNFVNCTIPTITASYSPHSRISCLTVAALATNSARVAKAFGASADSAGVPTFAHARAHP